VKERAVLAICSVVSLLSLFVMVTLPIFEGSWFFILLSGFVGIVAVIRGAIAITRMSDLSAR
jgi:hypothetical protein